MFASRSKPLSTLHKLSTQECGPIVYEYTGDATIYECISKTFDAQTLTLDLSTDLASVTQ